MNSNSNVTILDPSTTGFKEKNIVLFSILFLVIGTIGGYIFGKSTNANVSTQNIKPTVVQSSPLTANDDLFSNITFLTKLTPGNPDDTKTIFTTVDATGSTLYIADKDLTKGSIKEVYKFTVPGAVGFNGKVYKVGGYLVATYDGADSNDLIIFDFNGKIITDSLRKSNSDLSNWIISYNGEVVKDMIMQVDLFQIDNSRATVDIDTSSGKMVPDSLIKLDKNASPL